MRFFSQRAQSVSHGHLERRVLVGVSLLTKRSVQPVKIAQTPFVPNSSVGMPFVGAPRHHSRHDAFDAQCPEMHARALERKGFVAL